MIVSDTHLLNTVKALFVKHLFEELFLHIDIVLSNARCNEDKLKVQEVKIAALFSLGETSKAVELARSVLGTLGFPFPESADDDTVNAIISETKSITKGLTLGQLQSYPLMVETVPTQAMKIMSNILLAFSFANPTMFPIVACQMMHLTTKHGMSVESASAFANFGLILLSRFGNYEEGYRHGKIALAILDRFKDTKRLLAKVSFIVYGLVSSASIVCLIGAQVHLIFSLSCSYQFGRNLLGQQSKASSTRLTRLSWKATTKMHF